ncbi:MAG TPA: PilC/PilY family type IV pilus protein [Syntrophales bacterium]|nr:PilC/PilY family type IV pilus protein [Syntrophales bacterium]HQL89223.1 PilC/PilY family type IV pilus protein [Syntrophales bacterium]
MNGTTKEKGKKKPGTWLRVIALFSMFLAAGPAGADEPLSEEGLFTAVAPDAMIVLDLSGSMKWNPPGDHDAWNSPTRQYSNPTCSGPFYDDQSVPGYTTYCSRFEIARRTLFTILDDNRDGTVNANDETSMNIRFGLGKFQGSTYTKLRDIATKYSQIYCGSTTSCTVNQASGDYSSINYWMTYSNVVGATPLVSALSGVKAYLDAHKAADAYQSCRQKFVILVSDGADTTSCGGSGSDTQADQYKRRRESVLAAKALADAGYRVFVIGMGSNMPDHLKNTLNWMAYWGGTDNPLVPNTGSVSGFDPSTVSACGGASVTGTCDGTSDQCFAVSNDPGTAPLSGYAFLANNAAELEAAFRQAVNHIREATYSFTQASVASSRLVDENFLYEATFQPANGEPFWQGHIKKYNINTDGSIGSVAWDAGEVLQARSAASRTVYTYKAGALTPFTAATVTNADLNVADDTRRSEVVGFIRGESAYNPDNWKLGDTFRSNPITVGTPAQYFRDMRDTANAFATFRADNVRSTANGKRIVVAGANDGQLHAFRTSDGAELWSFIAPNLLSKLKDIAHTSHPTGLTHQYYVDGPISVADVWLGSGDGTVKSAADWKTLLIFAQGRGATQTLWSSSSSCDGGFSNVYSASYPHYCGYHALDITNTAVPAYKWRITASASQAPYLGDPWSKVMVHRVKVGGVEKWVGFFGGGHNYSSCTGTGCDTRGKGFFVVELATGNVLWSYTQADNAALAYAMPATPTVIDSDNDGFIDLAYIGDLGGNLWRFTFCFAADGSSCTAGSWSGSRLFARETGIGPVYDAPTATRDANGALWLYWGTGDKAEPIVVGTVADRLFGVKDKTLTGTLQLASLENITSSTYTDSASKNGWTITLAGAGEKCLSDPAIFGGQVYFTTYTPASGSGDPCSQAGTAKLYALSYISGAGSLTGGSRSMTLGVGIPTAPVLSMNPYSATPDLYVTVSGGAGIGSNTQKAPVNPPTIASRTNILHWRDRRVH